MMTYHLQETGRGFVVTASDGTPLGVVFQDRETRLWRSSLIPHPDMAYRSQSAAADATIAEHTRAANVRAANRAFLRSIATDPTASHETRKHAEKALETA